MSSLIYLANDKYYTELTQKYFDGDSVVYLTTPPDNVPTLIVLAKGTANEVVLEVTGKSLNSVTGVSRKKGSSVDHDIQTPVTCLNNEEFINQYRTYLGISWKGAYVAETAYVVQDGVTYQGSSYANIAASTGNLPTDTDYWQLITEKGDAATIAVGDVTTGAPGSPATVVNSGTPGDVVLDISIPEGDKGDGATVAIGTVTTGAPGSAATVTNSGTPGDAVLDFSIPEGSTIESVAFVSNDMVFTKDDLSTITLVNALIDLKGDQGIQGIQGEPGAVTPSTLADSTLINDTTNTDSYAGDLSAAPGSYFIGLKVNLKATNANTGASTLNVNSLGAKSIKKNVTEDLAALDIKAGQVLPLVYDGTNFQIVGGGGSGGGDVLQVQIFS